MARRSTYKVITDEVKAIRTLRERRGLSVNRAAPLIGTNKSTLTALENGRINLSSEWIDKILKAYKFQKSSLEQLIMEKPYTKEGLLDEIYALASEMSADKLVTIKQIVMGFRGGV